MYQICGKVFDDVLFKHNENSNVSRQIKIAFSTRFVVDTYLICLSALNKVEIDLFDINFDCDYINYNNNKYNCSRSTNYKSKRCTFNSMYACDQLMRKYEQLCCQVKIHLSQMQPPNSNQENKHNSDEVYIIDNALKKCSNTLTSMILWMLERSATNSTIKENDLESELIDSNKYSFQSMEGPLKSLIILNHNILIKSLKDYAQYEQYEELMSLKDLLYKYINNGNIQDVTNDTQQLQMFEQKESQHLQV